MEVLEKEPPLLSNFTLQMRIYVVLLLLTVVNTYLNNENKDNDIMNIEDSSLAYFRKKLKLTQKELSKKLDIKRYFYSLIETKTFMPDSELAERISFEFKVPPGQLWTKEELDYISTKK